VATFAPRLPHESRKLDHSGIALTAGRHLRLSGSYPFQFSSPVAADVILPPLISIRNTAWHWGHCTRAMPPNRVDCALVRSISAVTWLGADSALQLGQVITISSFIGFSFHLVQHEAHKYMRRSPL
jgi:hypothetical protein